MLSTQQTVGICKVNQLSFSTANDKKGYIEVVGDNPAYLISQAPGEAMVNVVDTGDGTFDFGTGDLKWIIVPSQWGDSWVSIGSTSANLYDLRGYLL